MFSLFLQGVETGSRGAQLMRLHFAERGPDFISLASPLTARVQSRLGAALNWVLPLLHYGAGLTSAAIAPLPIRTRSRSSRSAKRARARGSLQRSTVAIIAQALRAISLTARSWRRSSVAAEAGSRARGDVSCRGSASGVTASARREQPAQIGVVLVGDAAELVSTGRSSSGFGTRPIEAEKSRHDRNAFGSATVATSAVASAGPTPGSSSSRRHVSFERCQALICRSNSRICASSSRDQSAEGY